MVNEHDSLSINEFIKNIPAEQLKVLKELWNYFLENKSWPTTKFFRKAQGRSLVKETIASLYPIFIFHTELDPTQDYYKLTTAGVFAVEGIGGLNIKLILLYLDYMKKKFNKNPDFDGVSAKEIRESLGISPSDTLMLGRLINLYPSMWGVSASGLNSADWDVGVIRDIEDLDESSSAQEFLLNKLSETIKYLRSDNIKQSKTEILDAPKKQYNKKDLEFVFNFLEFNSKIKGKPKELFFDGHYGQAITEALKIYEVEVKNIADIDNHESNLMGKVFNEEDPLIKLNMGETDTDKNEQRGFKFISMGVIAGIRNPLTHTLTDLPLVETLKTLSMISLLFEKLNKRVSPPV